MLAGSQMSIDQLEYVVDVVPCGEVNEPSSNFGEQALQLRPGLHVVKFLYKFNPTNVPGVVLPPVASFPGRIGRVFIDNVYFVPADVAGTALPPQSLEPWDGHRSTHQEPGPRRRHRPVELQPHNETNHPSAGQCAHD